MRGFPVYVLDNNPGGYDEYGDPVASTEEDRVVHGCLIAPKTVSETTERGRDSHTVEMVTLVAPPGSEITYSNRVQIPSGHPQAGVYEVAEPVREWMSMQGVNRGALILLKRAAG